MGTKYTARYRQYGSNVWDGEVQAMYLIPFLWKLLRSSFGYDIVDISYRK